MGFIWSPSLGISLGVDVIETPDVEYILKGDVLIIFIVLYAQ